MTIMINRPIRLVVLAVLGSLSAGTALGSANATTFAWTPQAVGPDGTTFTADTMRLSDFGAIVVNPAAGTLTEAGYLPVLGLSLGGQPMIRSGSGAASASGASASGASASGASASGASASGASASGADGIVAAYSSLSGHTDGLPLLVPVGEPGSGVLFAAALVPVVLLRLRRRASEQQALSQQPVDALLAVHGLRHVEVHGERAKLVRLGG